MKSRLKGLVIVGLGIMSFNSIAATSGSFALSGVVNTMVDIVVTPEGIATNLDLSVTQVDLKVAAVAEASNTNTGYQITVSSLNNGSLLRTGGTEFVTYTAKYDGVAIDLTTSSTTPVVGKTVVTGGVIADSSDFEISYVGVPAVSMVAGSYNDTVSLEIAAI
jgi:hypothetical protein